MVEKRMSTPWSITEIARKMNKKGDFTSDFRQKTKKNSKPGPASATTSACPVGGLRIQGGIRCPKTQGDIKCPETRMGLMLIHMKAWTPIPVLTHTQGTRVMMAPKVVSDISRDNLDQVNFRISQDNRNQEVSHWGRQGVVPREAAEEWQ